jgi:hypothetical protein
MLKILGVPAMPAFKSAGDDLSKVALGRHVSGTRLRFQVGGILFRQIYRHVHGGIPIYYFPA